MIKTNGKSPPVPGPALHQSGASGTGDGAGEPIAFAIHDGFALGISHALQSRPRVHRREHALGQAAWAPVPGVPGLQTEPGSGAQSGGERVMGIRLLIRRLLARPLLTDHQRAHEFVRLSEDDCGHLVAYFADRYPAEFDVGLAAFGRYQHDMGGVA